MSEKPFQWPLDSYAKGDERKWKNFDIDKLCCYLKLDQLKLIIEDKGIALDSVDLSVETEQLEARYANDYIRIQTTDKSGRRIASKFRIRFANIGNKSSSDNCIEVVNELRKFIRIYKYPCHIEGKPRGIFTKNDLGSQLLHWSSAPQRCPIAQDIAQNLAKKLLSETTAQDNSDGYQSILPESVMPIVRDIAKKLLSEIPAQDNSDGYQSILPESVMPIVQDIAKKLLSETPALAQDISDGYQSILSLPDSVIESAIRSFVLHPEFPNKMVDIWQYIATPTLTTINTTINPSGQHISWKFEEVLNGGLNVFNVSRPISFIVLIFIIFVIFVIFLC